MIIMLAGKRKSGKTVFADILVGTLGNIQRVAFADILKDKFATAYGVSIADLHDVTKKEKYREALVEFADRVREADRYFFARALFNALDDDSNYIIDDLRAIEELELGMALGAVPYRIHADSNTRKQRGWVYDPKVDDHYLENEMDLTKETYQKLGGDVIYNNTNSIDNLKKEAYLILKERIFQRM